MGKKIITVDLNFPSETQAVEDQEEVNDPIDEYSAVKEEAASLGPPPALTIAKPKRKPAPKKVEKVVEEPVLSGETIEEPIPETITETIPETVETVGVPTKDHLKVKCQHCNKEMSLKSLKYSHSRNCLGLKKTIDKVSNEKVSQKREIEPPLPCEEAPPPPPIVPVRTQENPREERMFALKQRYNNLVKNAFN
jgi:aspartate carbamoyltransferase regulatory subunit